MLLIASNLEGDLPLLNSQIRRLAHPHLASITALLRAAVFLASCHPAYQLWALLPSPSV